MERKLEELGFTVRELNPGEEVTDLEALVLVENETTVGHRHDSWKDVTGERYHFPNQYRTKVIEGRPFVYYRGVRRKEGRRGRPEYFGVGRIGAVWRDEDVPETEPKPRWKWFCEIEDYQPFRKPVSAKVDGKPLEEIAPNLWSVAVRYLPTDVFERIHGIELDGALEDEQASEPLALDNPALAEIRGASVLGRVATGPRAGHRVMRLGSDPGAAAVTTGGPRHAHLEGFDLHANVAVRAGERVRLEHLCRYVLRPPVAQDALELTPEGKVLLRLRRPWRDGTRAIRFEPTELLEKLAAMVPRPRANLLLYHGAFAPRGCCREGTVPWPNEESARATALGTEGACAPAAELSAAAAPAATAFPPPEDVAYVRPRYFPWADLLRRVFEFDILACPDCGSRLHLVATIEQPGVIEKILTHLGLPAQLPSPAPARSPAWLPGWSD